MSTFPFTLLNSSTGLPLTGQDIDLYTGSEGSPPDTKIADFSEVAVLGEYHVDVTGTNIYTVYRAGSPHSAAFTNIRIIGDDLKAGMTIDAGVSDATPDVKNVRELHLTDAVSRTFFDGAVEGQLLTVVGDIDGSGLTHDATKIDMGVIAESIEFAAGGYAHLRKEGTIWIYEFHHNP